MGTGLLGQESQDKKAGTGKPKTDMIVQPGCETEAERPEHDSTDRRAKTGQPG